jgi:hypothetical protein
VSRPRFLADHDFNEHIISGVRHREFVQMSLGSTGRPINPPGVCGKISGGDPNMLTKSSCLLELWGEGIAAFLLVHLSFGWAWWGWIGLLLFILFWVLLPVVVFGIVRSKIVRSPTHCARCQYVLTGNTSGVCPECGSKIV